MATSEAIQLLKQVPLFAQFSAKELEAMFGTAKQREFAAGSTIVKEGDVGGVGFYLIVQGQVEVRKGGKVLATMGAGEYFGEAALLAEKDTPRNADVVAISPTRCLMLTRWDLRAVVSTHPDVAMKMMAELQRRLSAHKDLRA